MIQHAAVFAGLIRALGPYLPEVVFVGGWVHTLYIWEAEGTAGRVIRTDDIDLTLPRRLGSESRPPLLDLVRAAGFAVHRYDEASGVLEIHHGPVDLDLLTEASSPRQPVEIIGQPDLRVQGYPHQEMLRQNARPVRLGREFDGSLAERVEIMIPILPAYVTGKILSSSSRTNISKQAKDLVYVVELLRRPPLRMALRRELPPFLRGHAEKSALARDYLRRVLLDMRLLENVTRQLIEASGYGVEDETPVRAELIASMRRFVAETWTDELEESGGSAE